MQETSPKVIVGSEEWCAFPELGIPAIKARVDSGAKTSSLHAFNIQKFKRGGKSWVSFEVHPLQNNGSTVIRCKSPVVDKRIVKSSSGIPETRHVISTPIKVDGETWEVELTLTNRDSMGYRMLLGREAMSGRMLVDPSLSFSLGDVSEDEINKHYGNVKHAKKALKIGLLASDKDLYSNQRIIEAGEEHGHEVVFLNLKQCYMKLAATPEAHYRGGKILNDLDAVITRIHPNMTFYGCALARQFESMGIYTVNSSTAITQSRDRLFALQLMLKSGLHIPTTGFANSPIETGDLIELVGGAPLIVKLLEGTQGQGVVLAETRKAAETVINSFKALKANLLVQEFIQEAQGKNIRCFVIGGRVVAAIQRKAAAGDFRANIHLGGTASAIKLTADEKKLAIKAAKIFGLKIAGVDIIRSNKGPLLLEVNSSPGLESIETTTGKDIAGLMITSIEKKLGWKNNVSADTTITIKV
jgi:ribosomal protein S6--L-glutamate ligase